MKLLRKFRPKKIVAQPGERFTRYGLEFIDVRSPNPSAMPHQVVLWVPKGKRHYYWNYGAGCEISIREWAAEYIYNAYFNDCLAGVQPKPEGEFGVFFKMVTRPA